VWLDAGNTGTEAQFLTSLQGTNGTDGTNGTNGTNGTDGDSAYQVWLDAGNSGTEAQFLASINSDTQDLSLSGNTISLVDGGSVDISTSTAIAANSAKEGSKWENDNVNGYVKLKNQSDGSTAKPNGSNIFLHDTGQVSINTSNKNSDLTVAGSMALQLRVTTLDNSTLSYTIAVDDFTVIINDLVTVGTPRVELPDATAFPGRMLRIVNRGLLGLTVYLFAGQEVRGGLLDATGTNSTLTSLVSNSSTFLQSSGGNWYIIAQSVIP
ncbi:MAG: hypothetical protein ABF311_02110, partial [Polaribacter sp.]